MPWSKFKRRKASTSIRREGVMEAVGSRKPQWQSVCMNGDGMNRCWCFPGVANLPKLLPEDISDSSMRSLKNQEPHLKLCRPVRVRTHNSIMDWGTHGKVPRKKHYDQQEYWENILRKEAEANAQRMNFIAFLQKKNIYFSTNYCITTCKP